MKPDELEELKDAVKDARSSDDFVAEMGLSKLEHFIKKHEPKPPWPPEEGQLLHYLSAPGTISFEKYTKEDPFVGVAIDYGVAFPSLKMARFVRDFLASKTPEYWEKEMEDARD